MNISIDLGVRFVSLGRRFGRVARQGVTWTDQQCHLEEWMGARFKGTMRRTSPRSSRRRPSRQSSEVTSRIKKTFNISRKDQLQNIGRNTSTNSPTGDVDESREKIEGGERDEDHIPKKKSVKILRAFEAPDPPTVTDPPVIRRPGEVVDISTVVRNYWAFPLVGFNSILEIPIYKFEVMEGEEEGELDTMILPNKIFGLPLRPDLLYRGWWFYVRAYTGWQERMGLYKWEWPGPRKKHRPNNKGFGGRMDWRRAPGRWLGVSSVNPRPHDERIKIPKRVLFHSFLNALSSKFAQDQLRVVDHFQLRSHKTKHCVVHLRRLIGLRCRKALLVHNEGDDVNDNFRWATEHILGVKREGPDTLNVYNLLNHDKVIITKAALLNIIRTIENYPMKCGWRIRYATPDNLPAPAPTPVAGWDAQWKRDRERDAATEYGEVLKRLRAKWKWSDDPKGPMKVWRRDPLRGFRLKDWTVKERPSPWLKWEQLKGDRSPVEALDDLRDEEADLYGVVDDDDGRKEYGEEREEEQSIYISKPNISVPSTCLQQKKDLRFMKFDNHLPTYR